MFTAEIELNPKEESMNMFILGKMCRSVFALKMTWVLVFGNTGVSGCALSGKGGEVESNSSWYHSQRKSVIKWVTDSCFNRQLFIRFCNKWSSGWCLHCTYQISLIPNTTVLCWSWHWARLSVKSPHLEMWKKNTWRTDELMSIFLNLTENRAVIVLWRWVVI